MDNAMSFALWAIIIGVLLIAIPSIPIDTLLGELGVVDAAWGFAPTSGDWGRVENKAFEARCMEVFAAMLDCMDQGIGRLVETLKKNGQYDNTVILFLQDNGGCAENVGRNGRSTVMVR